METLPSRLSSIILACSIFIIVSLLGLSLLVAAVRASNASLSGNPTTVNADIDAALGNISRAASATGASVTHAFHSTGAGIARFGHASSHLGTVVGHGIGNGMGAAVRSTCSGVVYMLQVPSKVFDSIGHTQLVSSFIEPSDHTRVPVISEVSFGMAAPAAHTIAPPVATPQPVASPVPDMTAIWPIHGVITEPFGVPEWPFAPVHTGIDISDGKPAGVTPIHPFKPGRVIAVIHSRVDYGNHVIIDHGGGITSLYAHMYSTNVQVGQEVDHSTIVGYEGATGLVTGTHLHFEIRVNNQPVNPMLYVSGRP